MPKPRAMAEKRRANFLTPQQTWALNQACRPIVSTAMGAMLAIWNGMSAPLSPLVSACTRRGAEAAHCIFGNGRGSHKVVFDACQGAMIRLPYPPALNPLYRSVVVGGKARVLLSAEGRSYKQAAGWEARTQWAGEPLSGPVRLEIRLYRPRAIGDWDGPLKILCDALEGICYQRDSQIREAHVYLGDDRADPPG